MKKQHILIVEDEENLRQTLALNLRIEQYEVTTVDKGSDAFLTFKSAPESFSLVILDVMLPDMDGFSLCKEFRKINPEVPIIFLTAKNQITDKVEGLKLGADDYISKPFDLEELLLRVNNVMRRSYKANDAVFRFGPCEIDYQTYEIKDIKGERYTLSKREIGLLELLTGNVNKVISRDTIIERLWTKDENPSARTIDNYILNFRKYFEVNPKEPRHFHSVRGVGYKFSV